MPQISLTWPTALWALALIPLLVGIYVWAQKRRRRVVVRYSSLALLQGVGPVLSWWRRHLPAVLFLASVATLLLALARPVSIVSLPAGQTTIVLAMDVSRSMCSTDIQPNRLEAAKAAALSFVRHQDPHTQIGIVAFSTFAELVQAPTSDRQALESAINSLVTGRRTAIGSGILKALDAVAEADSNVAPVDPAQGGGNVVPVPKGAYVPDIIVLLTDGASNTGPLQITAAQAAADRGVRVYAIGYGTPQGAEFPNCRQQFTGTEPFAFGQGAPFGGGGGFGGGGFRRGIDEATLKQVVQLTGATYYSAESAGELERVFAELPTYTITKHETMELSVFLVFVAGAFVTLALLLSLLWHRSP